MSTLAELVSAIDTLPAPTVFTDHTWQALGAHTPEHITFASLAEEASSLSQTSCRTSLVATLACLKNRERLEREPGDGVSIQHLCDWVSKVIAPRATSEEEKGVETGQDELPDYEQVVQKSRELGPYGLEILCICSNDYAATLSEDTLLTILSFTPESTADASNVSDRTSEPYPWTSLNGSRLSKETAHLQLSSYLQKDDLIVDTILKGYLRPMFSRSRPKTVTASGRKAEFPDEDDPHRGLSDENKEVKPWKYADHRSIAVFEWAVQEADGDLISKQWPLFIPVLLTLVDDGATRVRARGLAILRIFLLKFPDDILRDTGLASVFQDAIFPTLHFLPSITPDEESVQLLGPAYTALLTLASKANAGSKTQQLALEGSRSPRARLLDKILRDGVFSAYFHAKEHVRIVSVLFSQTADIIGEMGIHAVKHLKDLIPMHSEVMTNPFAPLALDTLLSALHSLESVILNCWPRLSTPAYQDELVKALIVCFLNVHDENDDSNKKLVLVKTTLVRIAAMLSRATKHGEDGGNGLKGKVAPLVAQEPLLADLFKDV